MKAIDKILVVAAAAATMFSCSSDLKPGGETRPPMPEPEDEDDVMEVGKVGETLQGWTEGSLDIHFINTGRGESTFYVFPDGTTMLVDMAGSLLTEAEAGTSMPTEPRPNASTSSADVIVGYINHFTSGQSRGHIDYAMLSHYHEDHMGTYRTTLPDGGDGTFKLTSFAEIGTRLPYRHYLDRNWPDFDYPNALTSAKHQNVKNFVTWSVAENGTVAERFDAGSNEQIQLQYDKASYTDFKIQNLSSGGRYWTGVAQNSEMKMPESYSASDAIPDENCFSCAFWLTFGYFDFYTGGDLQYGGRSTYSYKDSEAPIAAVIGDVDVAKANHHGTKNCNSDVLMDALSPTVWVSNVWRDVQPNPATVDDVLAANPECDIFLTNLSEKNVPNFDDTQKASFQSTQGHVAVRVNKAGTEYYVYVLDDSNMNFTVKSVHGPYLCK